MNGIKIDNAHSNPEPFCRAMRTLSWTHARVGSPPAVSDYSILDLLSNLLNLFRENTSSIHYR